jgi:hypothetical protein
MPPSAGHQLMQGLNTASHNGDTVSDCMNPAKQF